MKDADFICFLGSKKNGLYTASFLALPSLLTFMVLVAVLLNSIRLTILPHIARIILTVDIQGSHDHESYPLLECDNFFSVDRYLSLEEHTATLKKKAACSSKHLYLPTKQYGITSEITVIFFYWYYLEDSNHFTDIIEFV
jgi:hypothetical protein